MGSRHVMSQALPILTLLPWSWSWSHLGLLLLLWLLSLLFIVIVVVLVVLLHWSCCWHCLSALSMIPSHILI